MFLSLFVLCFACIFHSSTSILFEAKKLKPVHLSYRCMRARIEDARSIGTDDTPILLLHGLGTSKESWHGVYQLLALKTNRKVCVADLRNHGDSPWNSETSVAVMAEDVSLLLETLKTPKIILLGHSLGGKVAIHFTLTYPSKVQKLIVEDMRPNGITPDALNSVKYLLTLLESSLKAIPEGADEITAKKAVGAFIRNEMAKIGVSGLGDESTIPHLPIKCSKGKCQWKTNTKIIDKIMENLITFLSESSGLFEGPSLFIYGTLSPFKVHEDTNSIRELFPKAELVGVEGAGHLIHNRKDFKDTVIKFINTQF